MLPQTKRFTKGVLDQKSGVLFLVRDDNVVAVLGESSVTLPGVALDAIQQSMAEGVFPLSIRQSFTEVVVPQLVEPLKHALMKEIRQFQSVPPRYNSNVKAVTIQSEEPLEFHLRGVLYTWPNMFAEYEGSVTWNSTGSLDVTAYGHSKSVPLGDIVRRSHSMLEMVLPQLGKLYATRS